MYRLLKPHYVGLTVLSVYVCKVKLVMSLLSDDILSKGEETTKDVLRQMNYIVTSNSTQLIQ